MIEARGLSKAFAGRTAVQEVSFVAPDGAITGLVGPNGAGKTTTLRMIAGLLRPDGGAALVDGHDVQRRRPEAAARLGVLAETHGLYARLTPREHLEYFGRLRSLPEESLDRRIDEVVGALDMASLAGRRTLGFSRGERLKVALACALLHDPRNLLLDEPTAGLDVPATRALRALLRRMRDEGRCLVLSSHVMQEVEGLCDQVVIVQGGRVAASGSPDDLRRATGRAGLEEAFVEVVGSEENLS